MHIAEGKTNVSSSSSHVERPRQYIKMGTYNGKILWMPFFGNLKFVPKIMDGPMMKS